MKSPGLLRNIPSVSELLENPQLKGLVDRVSHNVVVDGVRSFLDEMRVEVQNKAAELPMPPIGELAERIARRIVQSEQPEIRPVINATGIVLHTGLGRAPLAEQAVEELTEAARHYSNLETDLESGKRSNRIAAVEGLLTRLTGAEAALVVNNNAAATLLALTALAADREVVVSRGQLVEIGGSFRLPDVMTASGARLVEVGTTNKTRPADYRAAIGDQTAALMRVHTSNFRVVGFTESVPLAELVRIAREHNLMVVDDVGSGALLDFARFGLGDEPIVRQCVADGADVVLFSGDKLLGGPQCGIIVGRREPVQRMARHPLARALRVDKLTLAALAATLKLYRDESMAARSIPLLQLAGTSIENLQNRAHRLAPQLAESAAVQGAEPVEDVTYLGGGSVPTQSLPTWCIALTPSTLGVEALARALRIGNPAVMGRIQQEKLLLDLRSVFPREDQQLVAAAMALGEDGPSSDTPNSAESNA